MDKVELTPELLFCEKNNLTFWLIGGGLIGALREGGFVPWDDDVDVMLPREDYEKLPALWREQGMDGRFRLLKTDDEVFTGNIFITITDTNYTMVKTNQVDVDIPHGLVLEYPRLRQPRPARDIPRQEAAQQNLARLRETHEEVQAKREQVRDGALLGAVLDALRVPEGDLRGN